LRQQGAARRKLPYGSRAFLSARFLTKGVPDAILDKYRKRIVE